MLTLRRPGMLALLLLFAGLLLCAGVLQAQFNPSSTGPASKPATARPAATPPAEGSWDASSAQPPAAATGEAVKVYFYRTGIDGIGRRASVNVDGKQVCSLTSGRFYLVELPAGEHNFAGPDVQRSVPVPLEPGKVYYFKAVVDRSTVSKTLLPFKNVFRLDRVSAEIGDYDVKRLRPLDSDNIHP